MPSDDEEAALSAKLGPNALGSVRDAQGQGMPFQIRYGVVLGQF